MSATKSRTTNATTPIAAAGIDIRTLFYGAVAEARDLTDADASHPALQYAADRYTFHEAGYATEVLAVMDPRLKGLGAWWQQLFGESEWELLAGTLLESTRLLAMRWV